MFNLFGPSTKPEKLSVPVIDTSQYTEAQLNALPSEIARRNRIGRLAAAMRALHEQTMHNMDAGVLDEEVVSGDLGEKPQLQQQQTSSSDLFHPTASSLTPQPLKFHSVGWSPSQQQNNNKTTSSVRRSTSRSSNNVENRQQNNNNNSQQRQTQNRVIFSGHQQQHQNFVPESSREQQQILPPESEQQNHVSPSSKAGSWASASRQRAKLQQLIKRQDEQDKNSLAKKLSQNRNRRGDGEREQQDQVQQQQQQQQQQKNTEDETLLLFQGDTEADQFRSAAVELRNINLRLKVMYEKRYRARLDDGGLDSEQEVEEERKRKRQAQLLLKKQQKEAAKIRKELQKERGEIVTDENDDEENNNKEEDDFFSNADPEALQSAAKLGLLLEQRERELIDAQRQWRQSALDAELLTGELLRAQATIERYKMFMTEMTSDNEKLRGEVEQLHRQLAYERSRNSTNASTAGGSPNQQQYGKYTSFSLQRSPSGVRGLKRTVSNISNGNNGGNTGENPPLEAAESFTLGSPVSDDVLKQNSQDKNNNKNGGVDHKSSKNNVVISVSPASTNRNDISMQDDGENGENQNDNGGVLMTPTALNIDHPVVMEIPK